MTHILICTPMFGGMCTGEFARSLLNVSPVMSSANIECSFAFIYNDSLITNARNKLASLFINNSFTHLLFIDADIAFDANDIVSMVMADKDVIAGIYPKKKINWDRVEAAVKSGVPTDQLKYHTGELVVSLLDYEREREVKVSDPVEVSGAGTGFMLIKRSVFEHLKDRVDTYLDDDDGTTLHEYFFLKKDPVLNVQLSEDYTFCWLCREYGMKVYVAPWVKLSHTGTYTFTGSLIPVTK